MSRVTRNQRRLPSRYAALLTPMELGVDASDTVCRLHCYLVPSPCIVSTLVVRCGEAELFVEYVADDVIELPGRWKRVLGWAAVDFHKAVRFIEALESNGVWDLPECQTNTRDGFWYAHHIHRGAKTAFILMNNPQHHPNHQYRRILQFYDEALLGGAIFGSSSHVV